MECTRRIKQSAALPTTNQRPSASKSFLFVKTTIL